jgi:hypothetical protein
MQKEKKRALNELVLGTKFLKILDISFGGNFAFIH